jgi:hypothetical protein
MIGRSTAVVGALAVIVACTPAPPVRAPSLTVAGSELVLTTRDGRALRSADLVGALLVIGARTVRLDAVDRGPGARDPVLRHRFVVVDPAGGTAPLCEPDAEGERWAMPVLDVHHQVQLVCSSGAIAKCVRWGYPPLPGMPAARALHEACVRMVRADYGGTGATATRDGTRIEFCDLAGVHACPGDDRRLEAAWSPGGATCVVRPRIAALMTLGQLAERVPRLVGHLGPQACSVAGASRDRALLFSFVPEPG